MIKLKTRNWLISYLIITMGIMVAIIGMVAFIDPFFHYGKPHTDLFYYQLGNTRSQNNGIARHFDFDAIITGSSMAQNFKTTEMDDLFGVSSVKMTYGGASWKEINDNLNVAIKNHPNEIRVVVRCLDMSMYFQDKDAMRFDLGTYPTYLYDDNLLNDYQYVLNKDIIVNYCYKMIADRHRGTMPGITSFDSYDSWMPSFEGKFGKEYVLSEHGPFVDVEKEIELTESEKEIIRANLKQNIITICEENPDIKFYVFITPYSATFWGDLNSQGLMKRQFDAEQFVIETLLGYDNLHVFSFNTAFDITNNLDNYKDGIHYGDWINTRILKCMSEGEYELNEQNYQDYMETLRSHYKSYDFNELFH